MRDPGSTTLWVDAFRPGRSIVLSGGSGVTLANLYLVADGIRPTG